MAWNAGKWTALLIMLAALAAYVAVLLRNVNDQARQTWQLEEGLPAGDCVRIFVTVTGVNPALRQLTAQLTFEVAGKIARDEVTPSADLRFLVNSIGGQQEFDFPRGRRLNVIDATFPLKGLLNRYPLDKYEATLRFLVTTPQRITGTQATQVRKGALDEKSQPGALAIGSDSESHVPVPISVGVLASVTGVQFTGDVSRSGEPTVTGINLKVDRPTNLIAVSFIVMVGMMVLALSVFGMALRATASQEKVDYLPLSLAISLIFGLPALRNIQPFVPPVGVLGDYFSFIWAELLVMSSAVLAIWTWLVRSNSAD